MVDDNNNRVMLLVLFLLSVLFLMIGCDTPPVRYTLKIQLEGEGVINPPVGTHVYEEGVIVVLGATPADGWEFTRWEGDVVENYFSETTILMDRDKTAKSIFLEVIPEIERVVSENGMIEVVFLDSLNKKPSIDNFTVLYKAYQAEERLLFNQLCSSFSATLFVEEEYEELILTGVHWDGSAIVELIFDPFETEEVELHYLMFVRYLGGEYVEAKPFIVAVTNTTIVFIEGVDNVEVDYGTRKEEVKEILSPTTIITDSEGEKHSVDLFWSIENYDGTRVGEYVATGTFELPEGVGQSDPPLILEVIATIIVKEETVLTEPPLGREGHNNNKDYEWYKTQFDTGYASYNNCGPASTSMSILYHHNIDIMVADIRDLIPNDGGWWYTNDIVYALNHWSVENIYQNMGQANLISSLNRGFIAILCIDLRYITTTEEEMTRYHRYYTGGTGHFIIVKGYLEEEDWFIVYDPWSCPLNHIYPNGSLMGKERYYSSNDILSASQNWWNFFIQIGVDEVTAEKAVPPEMVPVKWGK